MTTSTTTKNSKTTTSTNPVVITDEQVAVVRSSGQSQHAVLAEAQAVTITSPDSYQAADIVLVKIRTARKNVSAIIEEKVGQIIKPIRKGLDQLYAVQRELTRDLDGPLEQAEKTVKARMANWQLDEQKKRFEAEMARVSEPLPDDGSTDSEPMAVPPPMPTVSAPVRAAGSKVIRSKEWKVTDLSAFIKAVAAGSIPEITLQVNNEVMDAYFESSREEMLTWTGCEIVDTVRIAGR